MAKKKSFQNFRKVPSNVSIALGTPASKDVVSGVFTNGSDSDYLLMSVHGMWTVRNITAGEGPVAFGLAHPDYSDAEIEECVEALNSIDQNDKIAAEHSRRLVRMIGMANHEQPTINGGRPVKTKLNWRIATGGQVRLWYYSLDSGLLTTGSELSFLGHLNIKFL